jgi:Fe-S cluster assembly scaffold protein SufB
MLERAGVENAVVVIIIVAGVRKAIAIGVALRVQDTISVGVRVEGIVDFGTGIHTVEDAISVEVRVADISDPVVVKVVVVERARVLWTQITRVAPGVSVVIRLVGIHRVDAVVLVVSPPIGVRVGMDKEAFVFTTRAECVAPATGPGLGIALSAHALLDDIQTRLVHDRQVAPFVEDPESIPEHILERWQWKTEVGADRVVRRAGVIRPPRIIGWQGVPARPLPRIGLLL